MTLTRLLYDKEHALASLATCFATSESVLEPLFWANELAASGFHTELLHALWTAYYCTCAINYPHIEDYITFQGTEWINTRDTKHITYIVSKLFTCVRTSIVLNHYAHHTHFETLKKPMSVLRGKVPKWATEYNPISHQVLRHIHRKNPDKALTLIARSDNIDFIHTAITECDDLLGNTVPANSQTNPIHEHIDLAKLRAFVTIIRKCSHDLPPSTPITPLPTPPMCDPNPATESHRDSIVGVGANTTDIAVPNNFTDLLTITEKNTLKVLRTHRIFGHHRLSNIFASAPETSFDDVRLNWLDLCANCPLWNTRIHEFGGSVTDQRVTFPSDDAFEDFHNRYDLDFDEQPLWVQKMSTAI